MEIIDFIKPELLILIPVLYIVGIGLKKTVFPDKFIPLILGICGVVLAAIWTFTTCELYDYRCILSATFASLTQGIICAGTSVYANQVYKQLFINKGEK